MELRACLNEVDDHVMESAEYEISNNEINHFRQMVIEFVGFMKDNDLLDENGDLNFTELDHVCTNMAQSFNEEEGDDW